MHSWSKDTAASVQCDDKALCAGLAESELHFWVGDARRYRYTAALVPLFTLPALWWALEAQLPQDVALRDTPAWLNSRTKLYSLYELILRRQPEITSVDVQRVQLCLDRDELLRLPSAVFLTDRQMLYDILEADPNTPLMAFAVYKDTKRRELYREFGVQPWNWETLIKRLDKLLRVYRYLSEQHASFEEKHRHELRRLPRWLCECPAKELALLPDTTGWPESISIRNVIPIEKSENVHPLLQETLRLQPLDTGRFIKECLLPQYHTLNVRSPSELCFPGSQLLNRLPGRFHVPLHDYYAPPKDDLTHWRWYNLFHTLLGHSDTCAVAALCSNR